LIIPIHPDTPLGLPENTEVHVTVVPIVNAGDKSVEQKPDIAAIRPKAPKITPEEFDAILAKHCVSVGTLPPDFSREDIYQDHD
jgi:hypothetical protein